MASSSASVGVEAFTLESSIKFDSFDFLATATGEFCPARPKAIDAECIGSERPTEGGEERRHPERRHTALRRCSRRTMGKKAGGNALVGRRDQRRSPSSTRQQASAQDREVCVVQPATPSVSPVVEATCYLRSTQPPRQGPTSMKRLSKVLMDGVSGFNILLYVVRSRPSLCLGQARERTCGSPLSLISYMTS
jgi:hypothetical protein